MNAKAVAASSIKQEKALKKKKQRIKIIVALVLAVIGYFIYWGFKPFKAGLTFGICKTFIELYITYPESLRLSTVNDFGNVVRIWFTQVDSFGQYRLESFECHFRYATDQDKLKYGNVNVVLDKALISRREIDPKQVERFNAALLYLIQNPPDLTIPKPLPDSLKGLQLKTDSFRKPIL